VEAEVAAIASGINAQLNIFCTAHTVCKSCQSQGEYEKATLSFSTICLAKLGIKKTAFTSFAHVQEHTKCNFQLFSKLCFGLTFCI
jgi:hypothetical protein